MCACVGLPIECTYVVCKSIKLGEAMRDNVKIQKEEFGIVNKVIKHTMK